MEEELVDLVNAVSAPGPLLPDGKIGVSLSGGGYRATMFALGALTAIHDAGLWDRVCWISSVSGGSFASAAAAVRLPLHPSLEDFDNLLLHSLRTVTSHLNLPGRPSRAGGRTSRSLIGKLFHGGIERQWTARADHTQPLLSCLERDHRIHAFMAVDLCSSAPVALTDRLVFSKGLIDEPMIAYRPGELALATAVRASATFPGLPAVRIRLKDLGEPMEPGDHDLFLVDGGAWNNLGTDWSKSIPWFDRDRILPPTIPRTVQLHLVVDASAPPKRPHQFWTRRHPIAYDSSGLTLIRAFRTSAHSTVSSARELLRSDPSGVGPVAIVDLDQWPQLIDARVALKTGRTRDEWIEIAERNRKIGTGVQTVRGLKRTMALDLLAHAHAQVHAHLTNKGVQYGVIPPSLERFTHLGPFI